jgi:hypothetical protein
MAIGAIERVSIWLDDSAPERGAFAQAVDWACRLGLPLRIVAAAEGRLRGISGDCEPPTGVPLPDNFAACEAACRRRGVPSECSPWDGPPAAGVKQFLSPTSLCVFGKGLADGPKIELLRQALRAVDVPILVAAQAPQPIPRVLVLNQASKTVDGFLASVARLCGTLRVTPVVLAVAPNEREALARWDAVRETWSALGLAADLDLLAGCDVSDALASVARWRRCTHIIVERRPASPWQRWLQGSLLRRLLGTCESVSVLALPAYSIREPAAPSKGERPPLLGAAGSAASERSPLLGAADSRIE